MESAFQVFHELVSGSEKIDIMRQRIERVVGILIPFLRKQKKRLNLADKQKQTITGAPISGYGWAVIFSCENAELRADLICFRDLHHNVVYSTATKEQQQIRFKDVQYAYRSLPSLLEILLDRFQGDLDDYLKPFFQASSML